MDPVTKYQDHIHYSPKDLDDADKQLIKPQNIILTKSTTQNLSKIINPLLQQEHLLLVGDAGIGKNAIIYYINDKRNIPTIRFSFNNDTSIEDLIGSYHIEQEQFIWKNGPLIQAMKKGFTFVADEINLAKPQILKRFTSIWSQRTFTLTEKNGEKITAKPTFSFVATQNPSHLFESRKELSDSIRKYFTILHLQKYSKDEVLEILSNLYPKIPSIIIQLITDTQIIIDNDILPTITHKEHILEHYHFNLRSSKRFLERMQQISTKSISNIFSHLYDHTFAPFDLQLHSHFKKNLFQNWSSHLNCNIEKLETLYQQESETYYDHKDLPLVLTKDIMVPFPLTIQRRNILQKIHISVQHHENILLEGPSTSRIYELIHSYALTQKKVIHVVSLTENTQTSDLFGALKPDTNGIKWNSGSVAKALESKDWIILENIESANSDLLEKLNMLLDDASSIITKDSQGNIKLLIKSKQSKIFAIKRIRRNPQEKTISRAFRNRFHTIYVDNWLDEPNFYHESMQHLVSFIYNDPLYQTLSPILNILIQFHCYLREKIQKNILAPNMQEKPLLIEETLIKTLINYIIYINTQEKDIPPLQQQIQIYYCSLFSSIDEQGQILNIWNSLIQKVPLSDINKTLHLLKKNLTKESNRSLNIKSSLSIKKSDWNQKKHYRPPNTGKATQGSSKKKMKKGIRINTPETGGNTKTGPDAWYGKDTAGNKGRGQAGSGGGIWGYRTEDIFEKFLNKYKASPNKYEISISLDDFYESFGDLLSQLKNQYFNIFYHNKTLLEKYQTYGHLIDPNKYIQYKTLNNNTSFFKKISYSQTLMDTDKYEFIFLINKGRRLFSMEQSLTLIISIQIILELFYEYRIPFTILGYSDLQNTKQNINLVKYYEQKSSFKKIHYSTKQETFTKMCQSWNGDTVEDAEVLEYVTQHFNTDQQVKKNVIICSDFRGHRGLSDPEEEKNTQASKNLKKIIQLKEEEHIHFLPLNTGWRDLGKYFFGKSIDIHQQKSTELPSLLYEEIKKMIFAPTI